LAESEVREAPKPADPDPAGDLERIQETHAQALGELRAERDQARSVTATVRAAYEVEVRRRTELEDRWQAALGEQLESARLAQAEIRERYESANRELEATVRTLESAHREFEAGNRALEAARRADTERIEGLRAVIPPLQAEIVSLQAEIESLRSEVAGLTDEVGALTADVARHDAERRATLAELTAIHRSKTWRLWMGYLAVRRFLLRPFGRR
jgi:chromosome segregation ATPase